MALPKDKLFSLNQIAQFLGVGRKQAANLLRFWNIEPMRFGEPKKGNPYLISLRQLHQNFPSDFEERLSKAK